MEEKNQLVNLYKYYIHEVVDEHKIINGNPKVSKNWHENYYLRLYRLPSLIDLSNSLSTV